MAPRKGLAMAAGENGSVVMFGGMAKYRKGTDLLPSFANDTWTLSDGMWL